jgi:hypothetical protein
MSSTNMGEAFPSYYPERALVNIYTSSGANLIPIYRCHWSSGHFTTPSSNCEGVGQMDGQIGWLDSIQKSGEVPLYRLANSQNGDHGDSTDPTEGASAGYHEEMILGYAPPGPAFSGTVAVDGNSHVVAMEYEAFFGPLFQPNTAYTPLLKSSDVSVGYDSMDPAIIKQHVAWFSQLGVDAIIADLSNEGPCGYGDASQCGQMFNTTDPTTIANYQKLAQAIDQRTLNLYPAFEANGGNIKIIPLLDGHDAQAFQPRSDGQIPFDLELQAFFQQMQQYPNIAVLYQGKPLILIYLQEAELNNPSDPSSVLAHVLAETQKWGSQFTFRLMGGFVNSYPQLWANANGIAGLHQASQFWTWFDGLNSAAGIYPTYTVAGSRVEAFTLSNSYGGDQGWNSTDGTAALYNGGAEMNAYFSYATQLNPIFLIVNQFNEFETPDQGNDENHSNDIEPTQQWGYDKFNRAQQLIQQYRSRY